jgi:GntR family transcriptional repressor for pyruvate dehydrogenase complex
MALKPVQKILISDGILEQIRDLIHSGEFSPGQRLPSEIQMTDQLSVSRSSLREALNALVHIGYLQRRNRGLFVAPEAHWRRNLSSHFPRSQEELNMAEMIEVRKIIETELCALAAKRAEPEDIKALEESLKEMKVQLNHPMAFINSDHHFHLRIAKAAKNRILGDFIEKVGDLLRENIESIIQRSNISKRSLHYHQRIFKAIKGGDASQARKIMSAHLADIEKEFLKILYRPETSEQRHPTRRRRD